MELHHYYNMSVDELINYYKRIKEYIEQGFRVEGIKEELEIISRTIKEKSMDVEQDRISHYLEEIRHYMLSIRH
ncbi:hypothetical protein ACJ2A9_01955 [Anaerobacillus sp. MEB173]|uniref:hypothetical protein n=1 Tax=Anaerobacillus sp. MEB173 TaxID=3383345 RepID=UPI003F914435